MTAHAIGYCRTSTDHQTQKLQIDALAGCDQLFTETVSGAKRIEDRPELVKALGELRLGDQLVVWRLDRLSRSLPELLRIVAVIEEKGADFASVTENLETRSPGGKLIFHIFGALAEWEREVIAAESAQAWTPTSKRTVRCLAGRPSSLNRNSTSPGR